MAEHAPRTSEQLPQNEVGHQPERQAVPEQQEAIAEHVKRAEQAQRVETARTQLEAAEADQSHVEDPIARLERQAAEQSDGGVTHSYVDRSLRQDGLNKQLQSIQRRLPKPERVLSAVIHQPVVRAVSEAAGKTISRPSGLLGGGLVAFIGSSGYLYLAKHLGFPYNSTVFVLLFVIGFFVGLGLELAVWLATRSHRHRD